MQGTTVAYSYTRFSTPEQAGGDSFRRQCENATKVCERKGWLLDDSLRLHDAGVSAFKGKNALVGNLRLFLDAIKGGRVKKDSVLIVESLDRISRQGIDEGYDLCKCILKAGVRIYTCSPEREYGPDAVKGLTKGALELQLILERAAEESETKSKRISEVWSAWRRGAARGATTKPPGRQPSWVRWNGTAFELEPVASAAVREIFKLAADGDGISVIVDKLNKANVPAFGRTGKWGTPLVGKLLTRRDALGDLALKGGQVLEGFYPAAVSEDDWLKARAALASRRLGQSGVGRKGNDVASLLTGLANDARDGERMHIRGGARFKNGKRRQACLISAGRLRGNDPGRFGIPYHITENAILRFVRELRAEDLNGSRTKDLAELKVLDGKHAELRVKVEKVKAAITIAGEIGPLVDVLVSLDTELKAIDEQREQLASRLSVNAADALAESTSLIDVLRTSTDRKAAREKMKAKLRQVIDAIWVLLYPVSAAVRAAEIQVVLRGGAIRIVGLAWCCRGRYPGVSVGFTLQGPRKDDPRMQERLLSNYRACPYTREFFDDMCQRMNPITLDLIKTEIEAREPLARLDKCQGSKYLAEYLESTLDETPPPARPGRPRKSRVKP